MMQPRFAQTKCSRQKERETKALRNMCAKATTAAPIAFQNSHPLWNSVMDQYSRLQPPRTPSATTERTTQMMTRITLSGSTKKVKNFQHQINGTLMMQWLFAKMLNSFLHRQAPRNINVKATLDLEMPKPRRLSKPLQTNKTHKQKHGMRILTLYSEQVAFYTFRSVWLQKPIPLRI